MCAGRTLRERKNAPGPAKGAAPWATRETNSSVLAGAGLIAGHGHELLNAFAVFDLTHVDIALGVHGDGIDPMKLSRIMAGAAERTYYDAIGAIEDPHHVVGAIGNQNIPLLRIGGKREVIYGPAGGIRHAPDSTTVRAAGLCRGVDPELLYKFALLGEDLNAVAAA